jgi:hypothetical protein
MTHYVGLDVSQKTTAICVVDDAGVRVWRGVCGSTPEQCDSLKPRPCKSARRILAQTGMIHADPISGGALRRRLRRALRAISPASGGGGASCRAAPIVSATSAPREPSGRSGGRVESTAV